jgi:hypothetical protein
MRQPSETPTLIPEQIAASCQVLADRIHERFPHRGIERHAHWFASYARQVVSAGQSSIEAPAILRLISWLGGMAAGVLLLSPIYFVRRVDGIDHLPTFLSSLDAFITLLAATVAGFFTMRSIELGVVRWRALSGLHTLRSFAHVTDMLQITKCPTRLLFPHAPTRSSPHEEDDSMSMSRYLSYCTELYALTAKVAVLYGEWTSDAIVLSALDDVEDLCSSLENKTTQKILLLEQLNQRLRTTTD